MVDARRDARARQGLRPLLRHAARAGRGGAGRRARRAVRHRLAGHAAARRETARNDLVSVFILPPSMAELEQRLRARAQDTGRGRRRAHGQGRRRDEPLGRNTTTSSSTATSMRASATVRGDPRPPSGCGATAQIGLADFVASVLREGRSGRRAPSAQNCVDRQLPRRARVGVDAGARQQRLGGRAPSACRLGRSILRRWPKAAAVTRSSARGSAGASGAARGTSATTRRGRPWAAARRRAAAMSNSRCASPAPLRQRPRAGRRPSCAGAARRGARATSFWNIRVRLS